MGVLYIDLFVDGRSMREKLIGEGLAQVCKTSSVLSIPPPLKLSPGQKLRVTVTAPVTPWDFYVQDVRIHIHKFIVCMLGILCLCGVCVRVCICVVCVRVRVMYVWRMYIRTYVCMYVRMCV